MSRPPIIPGTLSVTALRALAALPPAADPSDLPEARRSDRFCDRIGDVIECRRLIAVGASDADICNALGIGSAEFRALTGRKRR